MDVETVNRMAERLLRRIVVALLVTAPLAGMGATLDVAVVDQSGAPVTDAVAYAMPIARSPVKSPAPAKIVQREKTFIPRVTPIQVGTAIAFPNEDTVRHHVYSFSPSKVFELKLYIGTPREPVLFDKLGVVVLGCNIHDHMVAYILVLDTPHFVKSDSEGLARLADLPDGDYQLYVWHPRIAAPATLPSAKRDIRVPASRQTIELQLTPPRAPAPATGQTR
jgi:plastocyanin